MRIGFFGGSAAVEGGNGIGVDVDLVSFERPKNHFHLLAPAAMGSCVAEGTGCDVDNNSAGVDSGNSADELAVEMVTEEDDDCREDAETVR